MTAEQLNIKIKLDISEVKNGAKKVKQELSGMTDKVKQSLPKIGTESDKASKSLDKVSDASKDVKKSIEGIGKEARDSLSDVVTKSNKITSAFKNMSAAGKNVDLGINTEDASESTDDMNDSLNSMKDVMTGILGINVFGILSGQLDGLQKKFATFKENIESAHIWNTSGSFDKIKKSVQDLGKAIGKIFTGKLKEAGENLKKFGKRAKDVLQGIVGFIGETIVASKELIKTFGKLAAKASLALAGIGIAIAKGTEEYREAQAKLISAFQAAGGTPEQASQAYNNLFRFLGESDRSVEAANHLAKLTTNTQELAEWTTICQGIYATFGDSLPIEGLTEAVNETAKTSKVTGMLADSLNWAGVSEDAMNAALEKTNSLAEREALIRQTLNGLYYNAAQLYEQNNRATIAQNEAQARLNATMAKIGQETQVLVTSFLNLANTVMTILAPAISYISAVFSVLIDKISQAIQWLGSLFGISFQTEAISGIVSGATTGISSAVGATDALKDSLDSATGAAEKLKRTTMGFDELNIVSNPNTSSGGGGSASAGAGDVGSTLPSLNAGNSILGQIGKKTELIKDKIEAFLDKWKTQIAIIGGALAALGITNLLGHLGKAIGLGDKFLGVMNTIKKLAGTAIVITLQYTLMTEWLKSYIDGNGFKEYLKAALVGAIGTGILYAMWGPAGLAIGLGVTAVASLKTVFDNGGITNVQSAVVALTGVASAIGAIGVALNKLGLKQALAGIGTAITGGIGFIKSYIAAVKVASSEVGLFAAIFPKLSSKIAGVGTALGSLASSIGAVFGLSGTAAIVAGAGVIAAAIAGIVSVVTFLKRNWEEVGIAFKNFFNENIVPKIESIRESLGKLRDALAKLIPDSLKQVLKDIASAIGEIINKIAEWFKSVDILGAIGKAFEAVGGIIVGVVGGAIAGAINEFVELINGLVNVITGIVEIVSGVFEAIVGIFTLDGEKIKSGASSIVQGVCDVFGGLLLTPIKIVAEFFKGVIGWFTNLWDELVGHSIVPDTINAIVDWFAKLPLKILEPLKTFVGNVIKTFQNMWNSIKTWFTSNVAKFFTKEYWVGKFETIRAGASEKLEAVKTEISNKWNAIKGWFSTNVAPKFTREYWSSKFETIKTSASTKLEEVKSTISTKWNSIKSWFSSNIAPKFTTAYWTEKFSSIKNGAKAAFNGVISVVERAVNGIIRKINTLHWKIPDWVPVFGGDSFGFNIRTISIPRLATGGIATSSTLANIGERGAEAVLPLTGAQGMAWINKLADAITSRNNNTNNTPVRIVLQVGETELGYACIDSINNITKQTGGLKLHIV